MAIFQWGLRFMAIFQCGLRILAIFKFGLRFQGPLPSKQPEAQLENGVAYKKHVLLK